MIYNLVIQPSDDDHGYDIDDVQLVPAVGDYISHPYEEGSVFRITERLFYFQHLAEPNAAGVPQSKCTVFLKVGAAEPNKRVGEG